jgi:hypothetical protein
MLAHSHRFAGAALLALLVMMAGAVRAQMEPHGGPTHGDHNPHHGGFVSMYLDLHIEVVALERGGIQVYYTDAMRAELPASVVSEVEVQIERKRVKPETVTMRISSGGDFWEGDSKVLSDPEAIIRVAFLFQGKPVILEVPARNLPQFEHPPGHSGTHG